MVGMVPSRSRRSHGRDSGNHCAHSHDGMHLHHSDVIGGLMVEYDVLGNERHKAICKLREMPDGYPSYSAFPFAKWYEDLSLALGIDKGEVSCANVRDRLIHLLGGDQPTFSELFGILREDDDGVNARPSDSASADSPVHGAAGCGCGGACGCDGEELLAPITTELRDSMAYVTNTFSGDDEVRMDEEEFIRLCDNIDAIHAGLERENAELQKRTKYPAETERINMLEREVKHLTSECKTQRNNFDQATSAREHWKELYEQSLERIHDLEHDVEMWRDRAEDMRMERDDAPRVRHRYPDIRDANHVPIHIGDVMDFTENVRNLTVLGIGIVDASESSYGVFVREGNDYVWYNAEFLHHHGPTVEGLIRNAMSRCIGHLPKYWDGPIAECAAKLKLADA